VTAAIRRAVFALDQGRCTYTSVLGQRCDETHGLELHHATAFALGGEHSKENLTLRCRAHNTLAAEADFGRDFVALARDSTDHEPWVAQAD
jgi:5-methylcytosine-specific restriction endonuclease McrA